MNFNKVILQECFVWGDEEIKTVEEYRLAAYTAIDEILVFKDAEVKKL